MSFPAALEEELWQLGLEREGEAQSRRTGNVPVRKTLCGKQWEPLRAFEQEMTCSATAEPLGNTWLIESWVERSFHVRLSLYPPAAEANVLVSLPLR